MIVDWRLSIQRKLADAYQVGEVDCDIGSCEAKLQKLADGDVCLDTASAPQTPRCIY
jgi:hypothetical protein